MQTIDYSNKDGNQTNNPLLYSVEFIYPKYIHLRSSELELKLTFTDRLTSYITNTYIYALTVNALCMAFLGYVMYDNFIFILKANCTFMLYLLTINFFSSIIELFRILGMNIPTDQISICLLHLISIISFVAIVAGVICDSQTGQAK